MADHQYSENYLKSNSPHGYQWETEQQDLPEELQYLQQLPLQDPQQPESDARIATNPAPATYQTNTIIQLEEATPERDVPPQFSEKEGERASGSVRPRRRVHTTRPSAGSTAARLAARDSSVAARSTSPYHPYRRPQSGASNVGSTSQHGGIEPQGLRSSRASSSTSAVGPSSGSGLPSRIVSLGQFPSPTPQSSSATTLATIPPISRTTNEAGVRHYHIRSDVHYDPNSKILTAMLELPGSKRDDLSITLSACTWNRVKQITVSGMSSPTFPEGSLVMRERRFGEFSRIFAVGADTRPEDINAHLEDGVLTLKIACGEPAESESGHEIPIR